MALTPSELDAAVAKIADTDKTKIGVSTVSRVRACLFQELSKMQPSEILQTIALCMRSVEVHRDKEAP